MSESNHLALRATGSQVAVRPARRCRKGLWIILGFIAVIAMGLPIGFGAKTVLLLVIAGIGYGASKAQEPNSSTAAVAPGDGLQAADDMFEDGSKIAADIDEFVGADDDVDWDWG